MIWERIQRSRAVLTVAFSAAICALVMFLSTTRFFHIVELTAFDQLIALHGDTAPSSRITFVDISDETVKKVGVWPIPRGVIATLLRRVASGKADLIGLDMQLVEKRSAEDDEALAVALAEAGNVVIPTSVTENGVVDVPLPMFRAAALDVAAVNLYKDEDGTIRQVPLVVRAELRDKTRFESMGFATALASNAIGSPLRRVGENAMLGTTSLRLFDPSPGSIPSVLIGEWSLPKPRIDVLQVLAPAFDAHVFEGKIVIIGESSKAGKDAFETPLFGRAGLVSGPEIHAMALEALLGQHTVSTLPRWRAQILNFLVALLALTFVMRWRLVRALCSVVALGAVVVALAYWLLAMRQTWLPVWSTVVVLVLSVAAGFGYRFLRGDTQERKLKELFGRYVSSEVLDEVLRHPEGVVLEGQERVASVLFTDIRGFTSTSAGRPPNEVIAWLNDYFAAMGDVIDRNGGFLNKFIGDGLMVVFGAPVSQGEKKDAERAVRTALEMLSRLEDVNRENAAHAAQGLWRPPIAIGLGVHTGPVAVGNVGSPRRMEYSVIGETVNLAARLESATRKFSGVDLVISPATEVLVRDRFVTEALGAADAKGFSEQVQVYTVRSEKGSSSGGTVS
jgi:adenylate cyclase